MLSRSRIRKEERRRRYGYYSPATPGPDCKSVVYFVQSDTGPIKIGVTSALKLRLAELQTGCPYALTLLLAIPGDQKVERRLHGFFSESRTKGEWFRPDELLMKFIAARLERQRLERHRAMTGKKVQDITRSEAAR